MLIQDIKPKRRRHRRELSTEEIIAELYERGVTVEQVFGQFYAMQAAQDDEIFGNDKEGLHGVMLTIGDAELAGVTPKLPTKPARRQPF